MQINHKTFFDGFKEHFDSSLDQAQVNGIEFLLTQFETDPLWDKIWKIAYGFATTYHETAGSMRPVEEAYYLEAQHGKAFMLKIQKGFRYYPYFGRGFPQTTWLTNYKRADKELRKQRPELVAQFEAETRQKFDLINKPEQMKHPLIAFATMTLGMAQGWFTGKKFTDFKPDNYNDMRTIINGHDKAGLIAGYARTFEKILRASATTSQSSTDSKLPTAVETTHVDTAIEPAASLPSSLPPIQNADTIVNTAPSDQPAIAAAASSEPHEVEGQKKTGVIGKAVAFLGLVFTGKATLPESVTDTDSGVWQVAIKIFNGLWEFKIYILCGLALWFIVVKGESIILKLRAMDINSDPTKGNIVLTQAPDKPWWNFWS